MKLSIRPESVNDYAAVSQINRAAFGSDEEANLVDALRAEGYGLVSLVAELDGEIVGHILFSQLLIKSSKGTIEADSLAPMAVRPDRQRLGIGSRLVWSGFEACRAQGFKLALFSSRSSGLLSSFWI